MRPEQTDRILAAARGFVMRSGADMSELESDLGHVAGFTLRPRLHIVDARERELVASARTRPESGLAWARRYRARLQVTDTGVVLAALLIALVVRLPGTPLPEQRWSPPFWMVCACVLLTWDAALAAFHTRDARVVGVGLGEYKQVVSASIVTFSLLAMAFMVLEIETARLPRAPQHDLDLGLAPQDRVVGPATAYRGDPG